MRISKTRHDIKRERCPGSPVTTINADHMFNEIVIHLSLERVASGAYKYIDTLAIAVYLPLPWYGGAVRNGEAGLYR